MRLRIVGPSTICCPFLPLSFSLGVHTIYYSCGEALPQGIIKQTCERRTSRTHRKSSEFLLDGDHSRQSSRCIDHDERDTYLWLCSLSWPRRKVKYVLRPSCVRSAQSRKYSTGNKQMDDGGDALALSLSYFEQREGSAKRFRCPKISHGRQSMSSRGRDETIIYLAMFCCPHFRPRRTEGATQNVLLPRLFDQPQQRVGHAWVTRVVPLAAAAAESHIYLLLACTFVGLKYN